ncbi:MAG: DUF4012 domain-containing protein [Patescibacteria group bacterium]|nr:DUF4012 domain-containing protein [Patescibacteria group bacterium]
MDIIYKHIEDSSAVFSLLDVSFFPEKYQPVLRELQSVFYYFEGYKQYYVDYYDLALELLGEKDLQRYLFVFQNSAEIRPTGGFIGSLMLLDFLDGVYTQTPIDVYKLDGQLTEKIPIPYGLQKVAENFYLRDSNYWPDFPQSAEQISWFLEKE